MSTNRRPKGIRCKSVHRYFSRLYMGGSLQVLPSICTESVGDRQGFSKPEINTTLYSRVGPVQCFVKCLEVKLTHDLASKITHATAARNAVERPDDCCCYTAGVDDDTR